MGQAMTLLQVAPVMKRVDPLQIAVKRDSTIPLSRAKVAVVNSKLRLVSPSESHIAARAPSRYRSASMVYVSIAPTCTASMVAWAKH